MGSPHILINPDGQNPTSDDLAEVDSSVSLTG